MVEGLLMTLRRSKHGRRRQGIADRGVREEGHSLSKKTTRTPLPAREARRLLKELTDHQIELELQHDELLRARSEVEAALERYADLFDSAPLAYFIVERNGVIREANRAAGELLGLDRRQILNRRLDSFIASESKFKVTEILWRVCHGEEKASCELMLGTKARRNAWVWMEAAFSAARRECRVAILETTARKQAEESKRMYERKLRSLAHQLMHTEEHERRKLANDLHDGLGQMLSLICLKLRDIEEGENRAVLHQQLKELTALAERAAHDTHLLTFSLFPPLLQEPGLVPAARWLAAEMKRGYGLRVNVEDDGKLLYLADMVKVVLFRCMRELLINVAKHARAEKARIKLSKEDGSACLRVIDNGVGFAKRSAEERGADELARNGFGLFSIRERLEHLGGRLEVQSETRAGSCVEVRIPLKCEGSREPEAGR